MTTRTSMGNILIIDDDPAIVELLRVNLSEEGYKIVAITNSKDCHPTALGNIHLIIIDATEHNPCGAEFIRNIRTSMPEANIGIIHCAKFNNETDIIEALDAGADDCVRKPFSLREFMARVRAILRRRGRIMPIEQPDIVQIQSMKIDGQSRQITIDDKVVALSTTEFAILQLLLRHANTYSSRTEIFNAIWPDSPGANLRIVDTNISRLRHKLGPLAGIITNRPGLGYMLTT